MNDLTALLALRARVLARAVRDNAATVFVLGPLMLGAGLLLLGRLAHDLGARAPDWGAAWEPWLWGGAAAVAVLAARPSGDAGNGGFLRSLPLSAAARWSDRFLAGAGRAAPVAVVAAVAVTALGGGAARWGGVAALAFVCPLAGLPAVRVPTLARLAAARRRALAGAVRLAVAALPAAVRPLAAQDLLLVGRGFSARAGVQAALAGIALLAVAERALAGAGAGARPALLALTVAAWALAGTVFVLWERQRGTLWFLADAGCPVRAIWWGKVAVAGILGLGAGLAGAVLWGGVSASVAATCPLLGAAVGVSVGAMVMEGDGRPLLAAAVSLFVALLVGALVTLNPALAVAALPLAAYMERLALPRMERQLGQIAEGL
jgi:hypothetical protein